jgi:hypothetical protein
MILFLLCTSVVIMSFYLITTGESVTPKDCQDDPWFGE